MSTPSHTPIIHDWDRFVPIQLYVTSHHETWDHSVHNVANEESALYYDELTPGLRFRPLGTEDHPIEILEFTPEQIAFVWSEKRYDLRMGDVVKSPQYALSNPYLSFDGIAMTFEYIPVTSFRQALLMITDIGKLHAAHPSSVHLETAELEKRALAMIVQAIADGYGAMYVLRALFESCNDWSSCIIVRPSQFRALLLEAVEAGALGPDQTTAWEWLEMIAEEGNDPAEFMDDLRRFYDLLAEAAEAGNYAALDLMETIWPSEDIIEED